MNDSLFKSDKNSPLSDSGIGGLRADDDLSRRAAETLRNMQREDRREEDQYLRRETGSGTAAPTRNAYANAFGRAVQRGPQLASVFTIKRGNKKYLTGQSEKIASDFRGFLVGIFAIVGFATFFAMVTINPGRSSKPPPPFVFIIFVIIALVLIILMIRSVLQAQYFVQNGTLLMGTVGSASGRWVVSGSGKSRTRNYKVTLKYHVALPNGEAIDRTETHDRNDLAKGGLPEPGDPIAILYVPDTKKMRLL